MNQRIRELLLKAGWDGYEALDERNQKFAELIVRDVLGVALYGDEFEQARANVKQHFGVES